jgi:hypothetical protein
MAGDCTLVVLRGQDVVRVVPLPTRLADLRSRRFVSVMNR